MIRKKGFSKILLFIAAGLFVPVAAFIIIKPSGRSDSSGNYATYAVRRADMTVKVVESGTIKARNAADIKCDVEGESTIISIVPEGAFITEEDVKAGKILVELDSADLKEKLTQQEITYNSAEAAYTEATESLDIQKNQNDSDVQKGILNVKFALMDLQKYLGEDLAVRIMAGADQNSIEQLNVAALVNDPNQLGGESLQKYRELTASIDLADEELQRAKTDLDWTKKLYEKEYVARTDLESDTLKAKRLDVQLDQSETALDLFKRYEFTKQTQKLLSDYQEAKRELQRTEASTRSKLAQAQAKLRSNEATYSLQKERLDKLRRQVEACIIKAPSPGLVVYSSQGGRDRRSSSRTSIEAGTQVYQRQSIMSLPNAAEMAVDVKVHETNVDKVRIGQKAVITIDAMPDSVFPGEVLKIAPLPDPQSWMGNPDLKLYSTDVSVVGTGDSIRPGMSAKVEIIVEELKDVLSIPVQCVVTRAGKKVCYVLVDGDVQERAVSSGAFNDSFIQILEGLQSGENVLLSPPRLIISDEMADGSGQPEGNKFEQNPGQQQNAEEPSDQPRPENRPSGQPGIRQPNADEPSGKQLPEKRKPRQPPAEDRRTNELTSPSKG